MSEQNTADDAEYLVNDRTCYFCVNADIPDPEKEGYYGHIRFKFKCKILNRDVLAIGCCKCFEYTS